MKFVIITLHSYENSIYCVGLNCFVITDSAIARIIGISLEDYQKELSKFNGTNETGFYDNEFLFISEDDTQKCIDYLNEKYGVIIALTK